VGWCSSPDFFLSCFGGRGTGFEAEAVIAGFEDVAVVGEAVQQGRRHLGVAKDLCPSAKAEIGGDNDTGSLVEFAEQVEQHGAAGGTEGQMAEFVGDHEVQTAQPVGSLRRPTQRTIRDGPEPPTHISLRHNARSVR
jgi:hypothetical protein